MLQPVFIIIFIQQLYHGVRLVVRFSRNRRENLTVIKLTRNNNNNNNASKFKEEFTHTQHFKRLVERTLWIFRLLLRPSATTTAYWRCKERLYSFCGLELGLEIGSFNPSRL